MEWGGAEQVEGAAMLSGGVSLVRGKAVAGVRFVELVHEAISMDLGDDRCGGYRE